METLVAFAVIAGIGYWAYRTGKVTGSRGGFRAGLRHGRKSRGNPK